MVLFTNLSLAVSPLQAQLQVLCFFVPQYSEVYVPESQMQTLSWPHKLLENLDSRPV